MLPVFGSGVGDVTVAALLVLPAELGITVIRIVMLPPFVRPPTLQMTTLVPLQVPCAGVAEPNEVPAGNGSVTTIPNASSGPLFWTVRV